MNTVEIHFSKPKLWLMTFIILALYLGFVYLMIGKEIYGINSIDIADIIIIVILGLWCLIYTISNLLKITSKKPAITATEKGLELHIIYEEFLPWDAINSITLTKGRGAYKYLRIGLKNPENYMATTSNIWQKLKRKYFMNMYKSPILFKANNFSLHSLEIEDLLNKYYAQISATTNTINKT